MSRITIKEYMQVEEIVVENGRAVGAEGAGHAHERTDRDLTPGAIILATGGVGQLFRVSTNPEVATGDGIALAYRAGAEVQDMEFIQFHPTALRLPACPSFSFRRRCAARAACCATPAGERFMPGYHEQAELAPRDIVARAIVSEMQRTDSDRVYLDITHLASADHGPFPADLPLLPRSRRRHHEGARARCRQPRTT